MMRFNILQGDPTTASNGSKVIGAVGHSGGWNGGRSLALERDEVYCGVCRRIGKIV